MRTLKEITNRHSFESYPIQYLTENQFPKDKEEFLGMLEEINYKLYHLNNSDFYKINEKDLTDVKFFISELLYELKYESGL